MASISAQLNAIKKKSMAKAEAVYRESMLEVANRIIFRSPVDTGLFRANWNSDYVFDRSTTENTNGDESGGKLVFKVDGLTLNKKFYFSNSLHYAEKLEDGHSAQAANGMVKISAAEFDGIAQGIINKYK